MSVPTVNAFLTVVMASLLPDSFLDKSKKTMNHTYHVDELLMHSMFALISRLFEMLPL